MGDRTIISPKPSTDLELCPSGVKQAKISHNGGIILGSNSNDNLNVKLHMGPGGILQIVQGDDTTAEGLDSPNKKTIGASSVNVSLTSITTSATAARTVNVPEVGASSNFVLDQGDQTINGTKTFTSPIVGTSLVPIGALLPFAGSLAPTGYRFCDGTAVNRITYAALFSVISTHYGIGDGINTFNLPDTQAAFLRGVGTSTRFIDNKIVTALGIYQDDEFRSHQHTFSMKEGAPGGGFHAPGLAYNTSYITDATGGNETRPMNVSVNYIIRAY